jgi:hypothetical protein
MRGINEDSANRLRDRVFAELEVIDFDPRRYWFDYLGRLPVGYTATHRTIEELCTSIGPATTCIALFDPHPNNRRWVVECMNKLGLPNEVGCIVDAKSLTRILLFTPELDIYILDIEGRLLAVACHEDTENDQGKRLLYCIVRPMSKTRDAP